MPRTVACLVGTRPEAVKLAPIIHRLRREDSGVSCRIVSTGQHRGLLDLALSDFELSADRDLGLMRPGQGLAELTARALEAISADLADERPDLVLAVGDTTTVFASALACHYHRIPFGHVEAGLRTGRRYEPFPEEKNRELTARLAAIHFAPTAIARGNLLREGIDPGAIKLTGNPVIDALRWTLARGCDSPVQPPARRYLLVTAHRRENWGEPIREIARAVADLVDRFEDLGAVVPAHPNPEVRRPMAEALEGRDRVLLIDPVGYPQFVALMAGAAVILSDSGGVQEEGPALGTPVLVLRHETERPEAVALGSARLVRPDRTTIVAEASKVLNAPGARGLSRLPFGDGRAAERIVREVLSFLGIDPGEAPEPMAAWPPAD